MKEHIRATYPYPQKAYPWYVRFKHGRIDCEDIFPEVNSPGLVTTQEAEMERLRMKRPDVPTRMCDEASSIVKDGVPIVGNAVWLFLFSFVWILCALVLALFCLEMWCAVQNANRRR